MVRLSRGTGWPVRTRNLALFLMGKEKEGATLSARGWSKNIKILKVVSSVWNLSTRLFKSVAPTPLPLSKDKKPLAGSWAEM